MGTAHRDVSEELQLFDGRQPHPDVGAVVKRAAVTRPRVVVVTVHHHVHDAVHVADARGHHAEAVQ